MGRVRYFNCMVLCAALAIGSSLTCTSQTSAEEINNTKKRGVELIGMVAVPGTAKDKSGLDKPLANPENEKLTHNMLGGFSATTYAGTGNEFFYLSDRGPQDGAVDWACRFHRFRLTVPEMESGKVAKAAKLELLETVLLTNEKGQAFTGLASAYEATDAHTARLDPEGMRVGDNGSIFISDEYGPRLIEFDNGGKFVREFEMPESLLIKNPGLAKKDENPKNETGRSTNRGMEGLTFSANQKFLYGLMQSSLLQDSSRENPAKPAGLHCRLEKMTVAGERVKEMAYRMDSKDYKLNEILNCGNEKFIVIERDGEPGEGAKFKKLMLVDTSNASDISNLKKLSPTELPENVKPVEKKVLIDLLDPRWGLAGPEMPEKIEGLAFGPDLPDGRKLLVVTSDNDFEMKLSSYTYLFAVPKFELE